MPKDVQDIVARELNRSALEERDDIAKLNDSVEADLKSKGLQFIEVDKPAFRDTLRQAGFYAEWKKKYGDEAGASWRARSARWHDGDWPGRGGARQWWRCWRRLCVMPPKFPPRSWWLLEIIVLFAGVLARYVFQAPLIWSDELASILFLWLAMLGSVIALQRGEHMRLTAVVGGLSPAGQARAQALAVTAVAAFLLMVVPAGWDYAAGAVVHPDAGTGAA